MITFASPLFLWLLLLPLAYLILYPKWLKRKQKTALLFSDLATLQKITEGRRTWKRHIPFLLQLLILALIITALARPQGTLQYLASGTEVVLVLDISGSMMARDFVPSRIEAAKEAAVIFLSNLKGNTKVGLVIFSDMAAVVEPPTANIGKIRRAVQDVDAGPGGTAIGDALVAATNLLVGKEGTGKAVILLTDGENNRGVPPLRGAEYAKRFSVPVYAVGIGDPEGAFIPELGQRVGFDERTLKEIAEDTGGQYFHAIAPDVLKDIYAKLGKHFAYRKANTDISLYFTAAALLLFLALIPLSQTRYRTLP
ncbi:MAG: VWA domain-containing protein [Armatimonadetes bacterium]|nr:VWA domain-containing protein [Armatimonadota bacterium]